MGLIGKISGIIILVIFLGALLSPFIVPYDPDAIDLDSLREPPSFKHFLGTDNKGRDILSRILYGGRTSISVSVFAAFLSMGIGLIIGLVSGYFRGGLDTMLMALTDLVLSFPVLLLAIGVSVLFPPGMHTVMLAMASVGWASFARLIRGKVLSIRESSFIEAAKAVGCSNARILFLHALPQCIPLAFVMAGMRVGGYILTEAALSFLGLGAQPPSATWGSMISSGRAFIHSAPWIVISPGIMIVITALCFNILGDELRGLYDITREERI